VTRILDARTATLGADPSVLGFETDPTSPILRYLTLHGKRAYQLSWSCGTCGLVFERQTAAQETVSIEFLRSRLADGVSHIEGPLVEAFSAVIPRGSYRVALLEIRPRLVRPGDEGDYFSKESVALFGLNPPHYDLPFSPETYYYRMESPPGAGLGQGLGGLEDGTTLFEFLAPMISIRALDASTLDSYRNRDPRRALPTAVAISVLEIASPATLKDGAVDSPRCRQHWGWTHFLLDGHHKVNVAATEGRPVSLLSFLAIDQGLCSPAEVERMLESLRSEGA